MIHIGKNTRSTIVSKGISAGHSNNSYRGLVRIAPTAAGARNYSQCDSMLIGSQSGANTFPYIQVHNQTAKVEHEATTSKIGEDQLFYFQSRGIGAEEAVSMIINGFCKEVFKQLPMEFARSDRSRPRSIENDESQRKNSARVQTRGNGRRCEISRASVSRCAP
jgi:Fe-S cluster assembly protein SufB